MFLHRIWLWLATKYEWCPCSSRALSIGGLGHKFCTKMMNYDAER
jgi:hypothetical protein